MLNVFLKCRLVSIAINKYHNDTLNNDKRLDEQLIFIHEKMLIKNRRRKELINCP